VGEKNTQIVLGVFVEDLPECPGEDSWHQWLHDLPEAEKVGYGRGFEGLPLSTSYESTPEWLGIKIAELEYPEIWTFEPCETQARAQRAWAKLVTAAAEQGVVLPDPQIIVAHDE